LSTEFPDERLKLLFVCAHPAIDPAMHTPLMLQTVLAWMRYALPKHFLSHRRQWAAPVPPRDKKSAVGGIPFEIPQERDLPERLDAVLEAIYAAFGNRPGTTWRAPTSAGATWPRKRCGWRGSFAADAR